jgi:hypothetical protein
MFYRYVIVRDYQKHSKGYPAKIKSKVTWKE